jgi:O-antigen/teichoic acid export membrane protein
MRSQRFFKGLSWLLALNLLIKPVWIFFIDRNVQNAVGHEAYGNYFALLNLSFIFLFLADAGLSNMMNQKLASEHPVQLKQYGSIKLALGMIYVFIMVITGLLLGVKEWTLLLYITGIQLLNSVFLFLRSIISARQYFTTDALLSVLDKSLMILLCGGFLYFPLAFGKISLLIFLQVQTVCTGLAVLAALLVVTTNNWWKGGQQEKLRGVFRSIAPFAFVILLMSVHSRLDGFLLLRLHPNGSYEAGIYASAFRLLDTCNMVGYLAAVFLVPFVARHQQERKEIETVVLNLRHLLLFFGIGVTCFGWQYAGWIQRLLYHSDAAYHSQVIQLCLAVIPAYFIMHVYGSVLTATLQFRPLLLIIFMAVILNTILNLMLIPVYGAKGCCMAAIASQYFCALACYVMANKKQGLPAHNYSWMVYLITAIVLLVLFSTTRQMMLNVWLTLVLAASLVIVVLLTQLTNAKKLFTRIQSST